MHWLNRTTKNRIIDLSDEGCTQEEIAAALFLDQSTVSRALRRFGLRRDNRYGRADGSHPKFVAASQLELNLDAI